MRLAGTDNTAAIVMVSQLTFARNKCWSSNPTVKMFKVTILQQLVGLDVGYFITGA
jgi:hypothetical protein